VLVLTCELPSIGKYEPLSSPMDQDQAISPKRATDEWDRICPCPVNTPKCPESREVFTLPYTVAGNAELIARSSAQPRLYSKSALADRRYAMEPIVCAISVRTPGERR
jgi:hypothetical protein